MRSPDGADHNRQLHSLNSCLPGASQGSEITLLNITRQTVSSRVRALYQLSQTHSEYLSGGFTKTKEKFKDKTAAAGQGKQVEPWGHRTNPKAVLSLGPRNKAASPRPRPGGPGLAEASWGQRAGPISPPGVEAVTPAQTALRSGCPGWLRSPG